MVHDFDGVVQFALGAIGQHVLDHDRVGLIAHLEHIAHLDHAEAFKGGLEVVQSLAEVA